MINQAVRHSTPSHIYMCSCVLKSKLLRKWLIKVLPRHSYIAWVIMVMVYVRTGIYDMVIKKKSQWTVRACFHIVFLYFFFSLTSACLFKTKPTDTEKNNFFWSRKWSVTFVFTQAWVKGVIVWPATQPWPPTLSGWATETMVYSCSDRLILTWMGLHWMYSEAWYVFKGFCICMEQPVSALSQEKWQESVKD